MSIRKERMINRIRMRIKKKGPKTFKSKEMADKWAKDHNISNYTLKDMRTIGSKDKKIKIIVH